MIILADKAACFIYKKIQRKLFHHSKLFVMLIKSINGIMPSINRAGMV